jgi:hypothetical protein
MSAGPRRETKTIPPLGVMTIETERRRKRPSRRLAETLVALFAVRNSMRPVESSIDSNFAWIDDRRWKTSIEKLADDVEVAAEELPGELFPTIIDGLNSVVIELRALSSGRFKQVPATLLRSERLTLKAIGAVIDSILKPLGERAYAGYREGIGRWRDFPPTRTNGFDRKTFVASIEERVVPLRTNAKAVAERFRGVVSELVAEQSAHVRIAVEERLKELLEDEANKEKNKVRKREDDIGPNESLGDRQKTTRPST